MVDQEIPRNRYDPIYYYSKTTYSGDSFLLHPDVLVYNAYQYSYRDLCIYLAMASIRPYAEYIANGTITLELVKAPVHPHEYLDNPKLLKIKEGIISFPYEYVPEKSKQH